MEFINKDLHFYEFVKDVLCNKSSAPFIFVGSGISAESQLPSWANFINNCVTTAFKNEISVQALADLHSIDKNDIWLIDAAKEQARKESITEYNLIHEALWGRSPENIKATSLHYLIVQYARIMNIPIFTTNYDTLLEEAANDLGIELPYYESLKTNSNIKKFCLIYLHGRVPKKRISNNKEARAVATKVSYYKDFNATPTSVIKFRDLLKEKSCVFIGTSLRDDNINRCLLASKNGTSHYWFSKLNVDNFYKRTLYQDLWKYLNITPIYCKTRSYDEIKTALRRAINHLDFKSVASSNIEINRTLYKSIDTQILNIIKSSQFETLLNKCLGPYDETEFDLYLDFSTHEDTDLILKRVWSEKTPYSEFERKQKRIFRIGRSISDSSYKAGTKQNLSLVEESMDSLAVHKFTRPDLPDTNSRSELSNPRAWGYVSFPIIIPQISRCGAMFVLKYLNKNNRLTNTFDSDMDSDIIKLGKHISDKFRSLVLNN